VQLTGCRTMRNGLSPIIRPPDRHRRRGFGALSAHNSNFFNVCLYHTTAEALDRVCEHTDQVQGVLACQMLLEDPSKESSFAEGPCSEINLISEVVHRTRCSLLQEVNNVYVSS
jgi:uncharacterized protein